MATDSQDRLRYWVRTLGNLLGETIVEQEGEETFALEEELRALAKNWRDADLHLFLYWRTACTVGLS